MLAALTTPELPTAVLVGMRLDKGLCRRPVCALALLWMLIASWWLSRSSRLTFCIAQLIKIPSTTIWRTLWTVSAASRRWSHEALSLSSSSIRVCLALRCSVRILRRYDKWLDVSDWEAPPDGLCQAFGLLGNTSSEDDWSLTWSASSETWALNV